MNVNDLNEIENIKYFLSMQNYYIIYYQDKNLTLTSRQKFDL